ncbi:androgen-induced gene 1 protein isoform X7 [Sceloporus undulatus]|uniref:androgen-induced gene 1 protein isoform X7 n=1 Tax=Sceloporus undulatus TaxID=8520 RepID=UPI001C4D659E|nr:androgen-induced gene 1 protein isoform X7 [Sceloporus undulatus]
MALVPCQVLRVAILLSYFSVLCNYKAIDMPAHQTYGGSWKFLTFINLCLSSSDTNSDDCKFGISRPKCHMTE